MSRYIVVALPPPRFDLNRIAEASLPFARAVADRTGAKVVLVSVVDLLPEFNASGRTLAVPSGIAETEAVEETRAHLGRLAELFPANRVEIVVRMGHAPTEILAVVAEHPEPLLVVTSHCRAGLSRLFVGSVAFELVRTAPCPVLVVRGVEPTPTTSTTPVLTKVVIPLDQSSFAEHALTAHLPALGSGNLHLHLVHVIQPMKYTEYVTYQVVDVVGPKAREYLREVAQPLIDQGYPVTFELRTGRPAEEISRVAIEQNADLIAMTTHGRGGLSRVFIGSVAERLLRASPVPLLLVRPPQEVFYSQDDDQHVDQAQRWRERTAMPPSLWEMRVRELMIQPVFVAREETPLATVIETMLGNGIGSMPIIDDSGQLVGIITESDFIGDDRCIPLAAYQVPQVFRERISQEGIEQIYHAGRELIAREIMSRQLIIVGEDDSVGVLVRLLLGRGINQVPVVRDGIPVGIVSRRELLKLLLPPQAAS